MSNGTDHNDDKPELEFRFAVGWPEDVQEQVRTLFSFDLDEVQGRDRLGSLYFDTAPELIEAIRAMVRDLAQEPWVELPSTITEGHLTGQLQTLNTVLEQMVALSADHENAAGQKNSLDDQLRQIHEWFRSQVRPHAITARVNRKVDEVLSGAQGNGEISMEGRLGQLSELDNRVERLRRELESREDLVSGLREAAGESAGEELSAVFEAGAGVRRRGEDLVQGTRRFRRGRGGRRRGDLLGATARAG
jgi:hypothetical protein